MSRLFAELRRRPKAPRTASYELIARVQVNERVLGAEQMSRDPTRCFSDFLQLKAEHHLGIIDDSYHYVWIVKRADGSHFERRRIKSFTLQPDPNGERASDAASDWPCKAVYQLHMHRSELDRYIDDPDYFRDFETGDFVKGHPSQ